MVTSSDHSPKPAFFIVGAPKCGTTALYAYLQKHPDIFMCPIKEPQFFAEDVLGDLRNIRNFEDYIGCFAAAGAKSVAGEASVAYLGSDGALNAIQVFNPAARIIIMLRNPIDVMCSEHSQRIYDTREPVRSFQAALQAEDSGELSPWRRQGSRILGLGLRETARFCDRVQAYVKAFGPEQVHIVIYDDFKSDTRRAYQGVLRFLGVRQDFEPEFKVVHANQRLRSARLQKWIVRPPHRLRRLAHMIAPAPLRRFLGETVLRLNAPFAPRPPLPSEFRRILQSQVAPDVLALSALLRRDLSLWIRDD